MTFVITQPCIDTMDQSCVEVCPVDCIHFEEGADRMLYINPAECIDCGACQPACPVSAIFPEADVPADATQFTAINSQWYGDPAGARAGVGGDSGAPVAAPVRPTAAAVASTEGGEAAPVAAAAPVSVTAPRTMQVAAEEPHGHGPVQVPHYNQPSPFGFVMLVGMIFGFAITVLFPGPNALQVPGFAIQFAVGPQISWGGGIAIGVMLGLPIFLFFLGGFLQSQIGDLGLFNAKTERYREQWRGSSTVWTRSEETRRVDQANAVKALVQARFAFPTMDHPTYRTHVNVPEATMALEFGGGGGEKVFPDILVVEYPGNYPVMVAQVETRETVSRDQAQRVWKNLESQEAPLYIYVPSGYGAVAKDYARAAGLKHAKIRTWRRQPDGVVVQEI